MGLDRDFLAMLNAPVILRRKTGKDVWGNESYGPDEPHMTYISTSSTAYGEGEQGGQQDRKAVTTRDCLMDALGIVPDDILVIDGIECTVTGVATEKDETGDDLYQTVTVENQKKG